VVPIPVSDQGAPPKKLPGMEDVTEDDVSTVMKETGRWKSRWKIRDLFADPRCSQVILDFLAWTQVWRRAPKPEEEVEDAQSEASEWELREREERDK